MINKRDLIGGGLAAAAILGATSEALAALPPDGFGQVNKMTAKPGSEAELKRILTKNGENFAKMPECLGYVMSEDAVTPGVFWITEFWINAAGHAAAVGRPAFREQIAESRVHVGKLETIAKFKPLVGTIKAG